MSKDWPHSPPHRLLQKGTYMITTGTYLKEHFFSSPEMLNLLQKNLLEKAKKYGWDLDAWAIFSNHYHFIGSSPNNPASLVSFLQELHYDTAVQVNAFHNSPGRQVWHQFFDTFLSYPKSYFARLNYVMNNPVKHKLVKVASDYNWSSANWFNQMASTSFKKTISSFKTDNLNIYDEF